MPEQVPSQALPLWARELALGAVSGLFAAYDRREMAGALLTMCTSFAALSARLGQRPGLAAPDDGGAAGHIEALLARLMA